MPHFEIRITQNIARKIVQIIPQYSKPQCPPFIRWPLNSGLTVI